MSHPFIIVEEFNGYAFVDGDADDKGKAQTKVNVKHVGAYGIGDCQVTKAVPRHKDGAESILKHTHTHTHNVIKSHHLHNISSIHYVLMCI